jgi:hypothetical protein
LRLLVPVTLALDLVTWQRTDHLGAREKRVGITSGRQIAAAVPAAASSAHSRALAIATLITWLCTAGIGAYMLGTLVARGGLRQQRAVRGGLPPAALFGHFSLAITGLAVWVGYLATGWAALAWSAVGLLMPAIGLGISTVTLWTPYPGPSVAASAGMLAGRAAPGPAGGMHGASAENSLTSKLTDEVLARALTDDALASKLIDDALASVPAGPPRAVRKPKGHRAALIPVGHGVAAMATFLLAVVSAAGTR